MTPELRAEVIRIGRTVEGLETKFYFGQEPSKAVYPYAVLTSITATDDEDTEDDFIEDYSQITLYGENLSEIEIMASALHVLLQHKEESFEMDGYHVDGIRREFYRATKFDDVWQIVMQYKIDLTKI